MHNARVERWRSSGAFAATTSPFPFPDTIENLRESSPLRQPRFLRQKLEPLASTTGGQRSGQRSIVLDAVKIRGLEHDPSSTRARKRIRDYNNSGAERLLPREQRTNTQILIGDPPISASIHNLVQISTMSRQQRRSTQMQFAYPRPFSALYVAGSGKGWKGVAMVEGGSIFGKYLWRVETTELERTYSISLPALVERRMFVSRSEYHSGAPGKSRGSVGVIESVIHQRSSGMLIPPVADVHRSLGKKKKGKTRVIVVAISAASGRVASSHPRASIAFSRGP